MATDLRKRIYGKDKADPVVERGTLETAPTIRDLHERFMREHAPKKKLKSREQYRLLWERHILPSLGLLKVMEVTRADVGRLHHAMRGRPYLANRALSLVSKAYRLADGWGWTQGQNPARSIERYPEKARKRFLRPAELSALLQALDRHPGNRYALAALRSGYVEPLT